jgi:hypothetical protein
MNDEPKKQEPEIMPPVPEVEPERNVPEIPPDKDVPEKKGPRGQDFHSSLSPKRPKACQNLMESAAAILEGRSVDVGIFAGSGALGFTPVHSKCIRSVYASRTQM